MRSEAAPGAAGAVGAPPRLALRSFTMSGHLLLLVLDPACFFAAAWLATVLCAPWLPAPLAAVDFARDATLATWAAALLSPYFLFNPRFVSLAVPQPLGRLMLSHLKRLLLLGLVLLTLAAVSERGQALPQAWITAWLAASAAATALVRVSMVALARRLAAQGRLAEGVAVVGTGPQALRFIESLQAAQPRSLQLLGVFDDRQRRPGEQALTPDGSVEDLLALGAAQHIDWIVLALPPGGEARIRALVHRLKALSATIALCPPDGAIWAAAPRGTAYIGQTVPVELPLRDAAGWRDQADAVLPRWLSTLAQLAALAGRTLMARLAGTGAAAARPRATYRFDDHDLDSFARIAAGFGSERFGYVVTPNADHLVRLHDDAAFRRHYAGADHVLLDSRFVAHLLRLTRGLRVAVCTGSDLTARLFAQVIGPDDGVVLVGASAEQAEQLRARHGLRRLAHFVPPMGFIHDPQAVEACLQFIESHSPFRFCLLAVGSPQQEQLAALLRSRGRARGLALCIGASVDFLTGRQRRAPRWMQAAGLEWLHRLLQSPRRLAHRYLVRGPRVFRVLRGADIDVPAPAASGLPPRSSVLADADP